MLNITSIPAPGSVLQVGDRLLVGGPAIGVGPADLVGRDLDPSGAPRVLVGGARNLQLALLRRLQCPLGYLPHHPDYGSRIFTFLGGPIDLSTVLALRDEVGRTLLADPRVLGIQTLSVDLDSDVVSIDAVLSTVLGVMDLSGRVAQVGAWNV